MSDNNLDMETFEVYPDEQPTKTQSVESDKPKSKKGSSLIGETTVSSDSKKKFNFDESGFMDKITNLSTTNSVILGIVIVILFIIADMLFSM